MTFQNYYQSNTFVALIKVNNSSNEHNDNNNVTEIGSTSVSSTPNHILKQ